MNYFSCRWRTIFYSLSVLLMISASAAQAQDKIRIAYSSTDTLNQLWTIPLETGFYKKNGLDVDMVYIGSTTVGISAIMAQDISIGNAAGSVPSMTPSPPSASDASIRP